MTPANYKISTMKLVNLLLPAVSAVSATQLLLPLYNAPGSGGTAWSSVRSSLASHPSVTATLIINVANGPGPATIGPDWISGGASLASLPNVNLIGYVHSTLCSRPLADVQADVLAWSKWPQQGVNLRGIFVDETINNGTCVDYMRSLTSYIRNTAGLPVVVYNPGFPARPHDLDVLYALEPTFISSLETCFTNKTNGEDLCDGAYTVYDQGGYGTTIDSTLQAWVGQEHYAKTAVLVHGFHGTNGMYEATQETLVGMLRAAVQRGIGAIAVTTNHWITPDQGPADIGSMVAALEIANMG
ncbi:Spherulation-specific family 4 [Microdochium nivale]|nr:Spherulation-specific family 4 [Microdochium nivale]